MYRAEIRLAPTANPVPAGTFGGLHSAAVGSGEATGDMAKEKEKAAKEKAEKDKAEKAAAAAAAAAVELEVVLEPMPKWSEVQRILTEIRALVQSQREAAGEVRPH